MLSYWPSLQTINNNDYSQNSGTKTGRMGVKKNYKRQGTFFVFCFFFDVKDNNLLLQRYKNNSRLTLCERSYQAPYNCQKKRSNTKKERINHE
jgi:hypothetical protein